MMEQYRKYLAMRLVAVCGLVFVLAPGIACAGAPCDKSAVNAEMARLLAALDTPRGHARMDAAKADWAADGDFDNPDDMKYLQAAALWHDITSNAEAGEVEFACKKMQEMQSVFDFVIGAQ